MDNEGRSNSQSYNSRQRTDSIEDICMGVSINTDDCVVEQMTSDDAPYNAYDKSVRPHKLVKRRRWTGAPDNEEDCFISLDGHLLIPDSVGFKEYGADFTELSRWSPNDLTPAMINCIAELPDRRLALALSNHRGLFLLRRNPCDTSQWLLDGVLAAPLGYIRSLSIHAPFLAAAEMNEDTREYELLVLVDMLRGVQLLALNVRCCVLGVIALETKMITWCLTEDEAHSVADCYGYTGQHLWRHNFWNNHVLNICSLPLFEALLVGFVSSKTVVSIRAENGQKVDYIEPNSQLTATPSKLAIRHVGQNVELVVASNYADIWIYSIRCSQGSKRKECARSYEARKRFCIE